MIKKKHKKGQGSISRDEFNNIIKFIGKKNILDPNVFIEKLNKNSLKKNEVCFTFDDAIKCQIDIALPVLEDLKIKSFFFVYTCMFEGKPDYLEIFRYFRLNFFKDIKEFYKIFFENLNQDLSLFFDQNKDLILEKKERYKFYSIEDIKFRLVRDLLLKKSDYENYMFRLMEIKKFRYKKYIDQLFFNEGDLIKLDKLGHKIGLHSHSHPTLIENLSYDDQKKEYLTNLEFISKILRRPKNYINCCSHPLGSYSQDTIKILKELGIEIAFKDSMVVEKEKGMKKINNSSFEIARQDHIEILKRIN